MAQKYQELSDKIVGLVGGKANVQFFTHCVTRLRGRTASTRSSSARLSTMPTA